MGHLFGFSFGDGGASAMDAQKWLDRCGGGLPAPPDGLRPAPFIPIHPLRCTANPSQGQGPHLGA